MLTLSLPFCRTRPTNATSSMNAPEAVPANATSAAPLQNAPSGIAQLRQHADNRSVTPQSDPMNLDDFIFASSVGSPAGLPPSPSNETAPASHTTAPAIPIRKPNHLHDQNLSLAHASAPPVPPTVVREHEFGYVQRHVRKTSIDERRVSSFHISRPKHPSGPLLRGLPLLSDS